MPSYQETKNVLLDRPLYCFRSGVLIGTIGVLVGIFLGYGLMVFLAAIWAEHTPSGRNDGAFYVGLGFTFFVAPMLAVIGFIVGLLGAARRLVKQANQ